MNDGQPVECYRLKSGALYAASARTGGIVSGAGEHEAERVCQCGMRTTTEDVAVVVQ